LIGAEVTGTITLQGNTYKINGYGEHDHVWGEFDPQLLEWSFAICYNGADMIYFVEGGKGFDNLPFGTLHIRTAETGLVLFHKENYKLQQKFGKTLTVIVTYCSLEPNVAYPYYTSIITQSVNGYNATVSFTVDSPDYTKPGQASENNAFFDVVLCNTQKGTCKHIQARGWSEYQG
jgi:hypothetical protein